MIRPQSAARFGERAAANRMLRQMAIALAAGAALSAMAGCDRDAPAEPPAPRTAPASQADDARLVQAAPAGTSAGSTAEAPVAGPKGTEYPVPSKPAESQGAPAQH